MSPRTTAAVLLLLLAPAAAPGLHAELTPEWIARLPVGSSLSASLQGMVVEADGVSYVTGTGGASSNTDVVTAAFGPDGSLLWDATFDGVESWHDQARGIAMGPGGGVWVTGNTPGPSFFADVLVLGYDAATGALLQTIQYTSGPGTSEHGASIVVDAAGDLYVAGGTVGDGGDAMILKFAPDGELLWRRTWDGPASAPFSGDSGRQILLAPDGNPVVRIHGVMSSQHPDYVVVKYDAADGSTVWETNWGVSGGDSSSDMRLDELGDVYVTGTGLDFTDKFSTIKLRGSDGALLWQAYDSDGIDDGGSALSLDGQGGVVITGFVDNDGDDSNFNDDIYTVRRDAMTGQLLWTHRYGSLCVGCYDVPSDVRVDPDGNVFVAGSTSSPPFSFDVILLVLDLATGVETDRGIASAGASETAGTGVLRFDADFDLYDGGSIGNFDTGAVDMSVTKWSSLVGPGGIPCEDTLRFQARCTTRGDRNRLQLRLLLTDSSHDGETVTVEIDGGPVQLTVAGDRAQHQVRDVAPGEHTLELTEPAGCFPARVPTCP